MNDRTELQTLLAALEEDPGKPEFAEAATRLRLEGDVSRALIICLAGLSVNPSHHRGRLALAHIYYDLGFFPFAAREVRELTSTFPSNIALKKLLNRLSPSDQGLASAAVSDSTEDVVAEAEFDIEIIDSLDIEKKD